MIHSTILISVPVLKTTSLSDSHLCINLNIGNGLVLCLKLQFMKGVQGMSIYFNNAATTWPKPDCVAEEMAVFLKAGGANLGRGAASARDMGTMDMVFQCREKVASLFGGYKKASPVYVTFTSNITESLNVVLKGYLKSGMRVITSSMEHNSVIRPLRYLEKHGVEVRIIKCAENGLMNPDDLASAIDEKKTDLVVMSHCSNVCGTVQPLEDIARICREKEVPMVLDSAQTAGLIPINASELGLAALCFTGHKGLMGPQGIGGILWEPEFAHKCDPFIEGGTGSFSHEETQPDAMPDKFESGTQNLPGIAGLSASLHWLGAEGIDKIRAHENALTQRLLDGIRDIPGLILYGLDHVEDGHRMAVVAMNFEGVDNGILADEMSRRGIETRPGLQCSPWGHQTMNSFPQGVLRMSPGYFTTGEEVDEALRVLKESLEAVRNQ